MKGYSAFAYKNGNSLIHKMPAWLKILVIPVLNILVFYLPFYFSAGFVIFQFIIACLLKFSLKEQYADLKPVLFYAFFLYSITFLGRFLTEFFTDYNFWFSMKKSFKITFYNAGTLIMLLKLFCIMQSASIIFKTSTSLEIRDGVGKIEGFIRKILHLKKKNTVTNTISLFVCFIPMVYRIWNEAKLSWYARGGKNSIRMYTKLFPVLFSVGMKKAWNTARAMAIREN